MNRLVRVISDYTCRAVIKSLITVLDSAADKHQIREPFNLVFYKNMIKCKRVIWVIDSGMLGFNCKKQHIFIHVNSLLPEAWHKTHSPPMNH